MLRQVAEGLAQLKHSEEFADIARALPRAIEARQGAKEAGATTLGAPYSKAEKNFLELTQALEDDNASWANSR